MNPDEPAASGFVHQFVPSGDDDGRTLVLLHGTGGTEADLIPLGRRLAPRAALLGVRGKVSEDGAARFFRRLAPGVFDEADLVYRTHELAAFIRHAADRYRRDDRRLIAVGYSNGANAAAALLLLEPSLLSAAILFRALLPITPPSLPNLQGVRVFLALGNHDRFIPMDSARRLERLLKQAGAQVTVFEQDVGHRLTEADEAEAEAWLATSPAGADG